MVFRLTKKASEQTHISVTNESQSQNRYCDWFVDLFVGKDRKKYFLITNSFSLFSIVISAKGIRGEEVFSKNVLNQLRIYFEKTGHSDLFSQFIQPFENEIIFTKTNSRSVLKSMEGLRERAVFETVFIQAEDEQEKFFKINNHINKVPCKCANTGVGDYSFGYEHISSELMKLPAVFEESNVRQKSPKTVLQFYAELENYNPKIYRRFIISPDFTFEKLAYALMAMFNMEGSHLYRFELDEEERKVEPLKKSTLSESQTNQFVCQLPNIIIEHYIDEDMNRMDDMFFMKKIGRNPPKRFTAYDTKIKKIINEENANISFVYDFGDDWTINLILEKANFETDLSSSKLPNVLEGKGLGIIEDCGGVYGLENLRNVFQKKSGEEYEELSTWLGTKELDLDFFDIKRCNAIIKSKMKIFEENYWE